jgi:hypothetical protein
MMNDGLLNLLGLGSPKKVLGEQVVGFSILDTLAAKNEMKF